MKKSGHAPLHFVRRFAALFNAALALLFVVGAVQAQSTDIDFPTPVRTNEISATIAPRDIGDSRLTKHYYSLTGTPGDLIMTVESQNLNGDVDVFTASGLRPLAKISMYAGASATSASKTIFLRRSEALILRVEARSANDNDGQYRIRFSGAFEPITVAAPALEETAPTSANRTDKKGRRVSSVGARVAEPDKETASNTASSEATPAPSPEETKTDTNTTANNGDKSAEAAPPKKETARTPRTRRPRGRTTPRTRPAPTARTPEEPAPQPSTQQTPATQLETGPRLIIELNDGTRVERYMTTVRRVTVENGLLIVITKDGKVQREPMSKVLRMAIEP